MTIICFMLEYIFKNGGLREKCMISDIYEIKEIVIIVLQMSFFQTTFRFLFTKINQPNA